MPLSLSEFESFQALVDEPVRRTERQCQKYLTHATGLLIPGTPLDITTITEERNYFGSTDFIVAATLLDDLNREVRTAFIWELKAPQCYLFEKDNNNNRCRPTPDLMKAENQLLHYAHQAMGDDTFRARMNVMEKSNIQFGGIIIGRTERFLKKSGGPMDLQKADTASQLRGTYLYKSHGIRVLTWDRVLDWVRPLS